MFDWVLNTPLMCNANQLTGFYLIQIFTEKFFEAGYWNLKKIHAKYDKIFICKKNPNKNHPREKKSWIKWSGIPSLFIKRHALTCLGLYRLIFQSITKPGNWCNSKFLKLSDVVHGQFAAFCRTFSNRKNEVTGQMKYAVMAVYWLYWGSLCNYKKMVIVKMNKMLYF